MNPVRQKMAFFASLYFLQGAAFAYVVNFQKPYLVGLGISKDEIGLFTGLLLVPFILKVFFGALSDRLTLARWGRRKPFMVVGLTLFILGYGSMPVVNVGAHFAVFALLSWVASFGLALFDTCADGWAIDVAKSHEESAIQGAMVAGRSLGLVVMAFCFGRWSEKFGFSSVFLSLAFLAVGVLLIVVTRKAPASTPSGRKKFGFKSLGLTSDHLLFAVYGILYSVSSFGTDGLWTLFLSEVHKANFSEIGSFGVARGLGALMGAVLAGWLGIRISAGKLARIALFVLGVGTLLPLLDGAMLLQGSLWGMCWGFQETAFVTLAMILARGPWSATLFAGAMIFSNIGTSLGEAIATPMSSRIGYLPVFMILGSLAWLAIFFLPRRLNSN